MFSAGGINSGLDVNAMVNSLVAAERAPKESQITRSRNAYNVELSALGSIQSAIDEFSKAVEALNKPESFQARTVKLSDTDAFNVTAGSASVTGSYKIKVNALASNHSISTASFQDADTFGTGNLTINLGAKNFTVALTSSNNTLTGIRDAINNASDNPGVQATIVNDGSGKRLLLTSKDSGAANTISLNSSLTVGGSDKDIISGQVELSPAADAEIVLGEGAGQITIKSADNTFEDLIDGVTLEVKKVTASSVSVDISQKPEAAEDVIKSFVDAYNKLIGKVNELTLYKPGQDAAALVGDATMRAMQSQLRRIIGDNPGAGKITMLADMGIKTQPDGTLLISSTKLTEAVKNNFSELESFFTGATGMAGKLDTLLNTYDAKDGLLKSRMDSINKSLSKLTDEEEALNVRMESLQERLKKQFLAMDALVGKLNATSTFLTNSLLNVNNTRK